VAVDAFGERVELELPFASRHNAENLLPALAAYGALGLPLAAAAAGAPDIRLSRWRGEELPLPGGGLLINDAYNANPLSMKAALEHLRDRADGRRTVAVLGDMAELGPDAPVYHEEIGRAAAATGVAALVAVGPLARGYLEGAGGVEVTRWAPDAEAAIAETEAVLEPGDCVLLKASRSVGLEILADALAVEPAAR
jgi:UDP-N-acetylmuramoyl-tripeptide--D-alanyl-D-alanine ligase